MENLIINEREIERIGDRMELMAMEVAEAERLFEQEHEDLLRALQGKGLGCSENKFETHHAVAQSFNCYQYAYERLAKARAEYNSAKRMLKALGIEA